MGVMFNKCCFCIELKSGCLIIGYLNLIGHIAFILNLIFGMGAFGVVTTAQADNKDFHEAKEDFMFVATRTVLVIAILFLAFTIVLLVGLHKNKRGHVKVYQTYAMIFFVLYIIMILLFVTFGGPVYVRDIVWQLSTILVDIYFLLVIRNYYQTMDDPAYKPAMWIT